MAFSDFKNIFEVAEKYAIDIQKDKIFLNIAPYTLEQHFLDDLAYSFENKSPASSEIAVSEAFIFPTMKYVCKQHPHIKCWSREFDIKIDDNLKGTPDYVFSYRKNPKQLVRTMPLVCVAEAKIDDFTGAWGQALAEMLALSKLQPTFTIFGWATNGEIWQFGKLENDIFTQHELSYSLSSEPEQITGILDYIFTFVKQQVENWILSQKQQNNETTK